MIIADEKLLATYRGPGFCEHCRRMTPRRQPHHIFCRGMGGAHRLDVAINLIALCPDCHARFHNGRILRATFLAIVAQREGRLQDEMEAELWRLRRE